MANSVGLPPQEQTLEPLILEVLTIAWRFGMFTKGNEARRLATPIAEAACRGWITVETAPGFYGNKWHIKEEGLKVLMQHQQRKHEEGNGE